MGQANEKEPVSRTEDTTSSWREESSAFIITLPDAQIIQPLDLIPAFKTHLLSSFENEPSDQSQDNVKASPVPAVVTSVTPCPKVQRAEYVPDVSTLPRPDVLLLKPPYHAFVYLRGRNEVEVQATHSPTLDFIADLPPEVVPCKPSSIS